MHKNDDMMNHRAKTGRQFTLLRPHTTYIQLLSVLVLIGCVGQIQQNGVSDNAADKNLYAGDRSNINEENELKDDQEYIVHTVLVDGKPVQDTLIMPGLYPIQRDTAEYHYYGEIKLKKYAYNPIKRTGGGYASETIDGFRYGEGYPGVLTKSDSRSHKLVEFIYFDHTQAQKLKVVNIWNKNPYLSRYTNIKAAYPSFEHYSRPPDNLLSWYRSQEPDEYLSFYDGGSGNYTGYKNIIYSLIGIKNGHISSWESTLVIFDPKGDVVFQITEPNQIGYAIISDDGTLVAYNYGNYLDNPHNDAPLGEVRIREVGSGALIYKTKAEEGIRFAVGTIPGLANFIGIGRTQYLKRPPHDPPDTIKIELIDLVTRSIFIREFTCSEYVDAKADHITLLTRYNFKKSEF